MLSLQNILVRVGDKTLLEVEQLLLKPGELVGVVGPNGAGKSTMLKVISGETQPDRGTVLIDGNDIASWSMKQLAWRRAILPQSSSLMFAFSVFEVVLMGRCPFNNGLFSKNDHELARHAMSLTDTEHLAERSYPQLSGGEKQRVQLARVLAQIWRQDDIESRYLLLDEPTSALDIAHQHQTLAIARQFTYEQNVAAVLILHDLNLAAQYVDKLVMLRQGEMVAQGTPADVLKKEIVTDVFQHPVSVLEHPNISDVPLVVTARYEKQIGL